MQTHSVATECVFELSIFIKIVEQCYCAPTEIRTPVLALKGLRPGPLDDGGVFEADGFYHPLFVRSSISTNLIYYPISY